MCNFSRYKNSKAANIGNISSQTSKKDKKLRHLTSLFIIDKKYTGGRAGILFFPFFHIIRLSLKYIHLTFFVEALSGCSRDWPWGRSAGLRWCHRSSTTKITIF